MKFLGFFFSLLFMSSMSFAQASDNAKTLADQGIIANLIALNNNEISAANSVTGKTTTKSIIKYAQLMKKEHSKNLHKTMEISKKQKLSPLDDEATAILKRQGEQESTELASLEKNNFDKGYIGDMVKDHENALTLIEQCLNQVSNTQLKKHLLATKIHVQQHLNEAQKIQKQLS